MIYSTSRTPFLSRIPLPHPGECLEHGSKRLVKSSLILAPLLEKPDRVVLGSVTEIGKGKDTSRRRPYRPGPPRTPQRPEEQPKGDARSVRDVCCRWKIYYFTPGGFLYRRDP